MTVSPLLGGYEIAPLNLIGGYYRQWIETIWT